jgi:hypothetical protein
VKREKGKVKGKVKRKSLKGKIQTWENGGGNSPFSRFPTACDPPDT